jgi:arginyl-tRNA synthetase
MLSFEGNSAPYLMYTLARAKSVLRKSEVSAGDLSNFELHAEIDAEMQLILQLMMYPEVLVRAVEEFKPNHVANYLYQLAQDYNHFYNGNSILQAESELLKHSRLLMTATVVKVMELGFEALGLESLERM